MKHNYKYDEVKPLDKKWLSDKDLNPVIVETAGFVPLEVKIKRFEQAGLKAQFTSSDFTSSDLRDIYLNHPNFDIYPDDDLEDVQEKLVGLEMYKREFLAHKLGENDERSEELQPSRAKGATANSVSDNDTDEQ